MLLVLFSVHGEHRFSALPMPSPESHTKTGGRLSGYDVQRYVEDFRVRFLNGKIRFETEVLNIRRGDRGQGWSVRVRDMKSASPDTAVQVLHYRRIVLCTGVSFVGPIIIAIESHRRPRHGLQGSSNPSFPETLSPAAAKTAQFSGPVLHSMHFASRINDLLECTAPDLRPAPVVVVGGGKSAQEWARYLLHPGVTSDGSF